jgi:NADH-quinone oxidoreductase subunit C
VDLVQSSIDAIQTRFGDAFLGVGEHAGQRWVFVRREPIVAILTMLRDERSFDMLMDLTAVDWLNQGQTERYCMVYVLYSLKENVYLRIKAWVPEDDPTIDTISDLWPAAPWAEREVYDMFGIVFRGHRDLKRILCPFDYTGYPLRKDYPLVGHGERHNFPKYVK